MKPDCAHPKAGYKDISKRWYDSPRPTVSTVSDFIGGWYHNL